jgi:hypothetical protein
MIWAVSLLRSDLSAGFLTALIDSQEFGVWLRVLRRTANSHSVALPLVNNYKTLALKLFRREPAIAEFGWNFSPTHKSSPSVARLVGAGLPPILLEVHPAHA